MNVGLAYNLKKECSSNDEEPPGTFRDSEAEWDDQTTIDAVREALAQRHNVIPIEANGDAFNKLTNYKSQLDIVFNMAEVYMVSVAKRRFPRCSNTWGFPTRRRTR